MICNQTFKGNTAEFTQTVKDALNVLGKKNLALILQGVSFPSAGGENTGFGTYNSEGGRNLIDFASHIFNAIQLGPVGKTKASDPSPYCGTIFSGNPLFVDLKALTQKKWEKLLSEETFEKIVANNPSHDPLRASYQYSSQMYDMAFSEVYENFKKRASWFLKRKFDAFKKENAFWLDNDSLYEAFVLENKSDYWPQWESELDRNIFKPKDSNAAKKRVEEVTKKYYDVIEKYKLTQFIFALQSEQTRQYAKSKGIKMIADRQVAFSDRDCWA
jgi:4-alpha-glucanotransferase